LLHVQPLMQLVVLGSAQLPRSKQQWHSTVLTMVFVLHSAADDWAWSCSAAGAAHS
jgi:hypothetical protein